MGENEQQIKSYLQRIVNKLLINGGFLGFPGLYNGEMGLVIFFTRYGRIMQNELYSDYSFDLIEKIQQRIDHETPLNYKYGLSGIGAAFEYLVQNDYFKADTDDILDDFDKRLFSSHHLHYLPIDEIMGIGYYALWRMSGNSSKKETVRQAILPQIVNVIEEWHQHNNSNSSTVTFFRQFMLPENSFTRQDDRDVPAWLPIYRKYNPDDFKSKTEVYSLEKISISDYFMNKNVHLGFQNGLAGLGLSLLSALDGDYSWVSLFPNDIYPNIR